MCLWFLQFLHRDMPGFFPALFWFDPFVLGKPEVLNERDNDFRDTKLPLVVL